MRAPMADQSDVPTVAVALGTRSSKRQAGGHEAASTPLPPGRLSTRPQPRLQARTPITVHGTLRRGSTRPGARLGPGEGRLKQLRAGHAVCSAEWLGLVAQGDRVVVHPRTRPGHNRAVTEHHRRRAMLGPVWKTGRDQRSARHDRGIEQFAVHTAESRRRGVIDGSLGRPCGSQARWRARKSAERRAMGSGSTPKKACPAPSIHSSSLVAPTACRA